MGKWCRHSLFIFDRIIIKVAGNQDRHKSSVKLDSGLNQTTHFGVTCPWVTKISHFGTWISLKPVSQSWSNFMCSIIRVGERLHKVLGQIDLAYCTQVSDCCPLGYLFFLVKSYVPFLELCPFEKMGMKSCQMSKSNWARGLKLGQLTVDDE